MSRILGIDYGQRRIGLAIGTMGSTLAMPWRIVDAVGDPLQDAQRLASELADSDETFSRAVVGLPLNMDGSEGAQAKLTREFGARFGEAAGMEIVFWDERLSSYEARNRLTPTTSAPRSGNKKPKRPAKRIDAVAAAVILGEYLQKHSNDENNPA